MQLLGYLDGGVVTLGALIACNNCITNKKRPLLSGRFFLNKIQSQTLIKYEHKQTTKQRR